jgi:ribonuclease HI
MSFYAVAKGRHTGLFSTWKECQSSVIGFPNARFKKFETREEAERFIHPEPDLVTKPECTETDGSDYYVYTDGGCSNNGKRNAVSGIGIFFGVGDPRNVSRRIQGKQTNNTAELTAILEAYPLIEEDIVLDKRITIVSDSEYAIRCVTSYGDKCEKQGWPEMPNRELVKAVYDLYKDTSVQFMHIKAHTNRKDIHSVGNSHADSLATMAFN